MKNQNDTVKRHDLNQSDTGLKSLAVVGIFSNPTEKTLYACTQKIEKIVAGIYLITDVMDESLSLTATLRDRALVLLTSCYNLLDTAISPKSLARVAIHIEEVSSLVGIGRIAHHISDMNAAIIENEFARVREVIIGEHKVLSDKVSAYQAVDQTPQSVLEHKVIQDELFDRISNERKLIHMAQRIKTQVRPLTPSPFKTTFKTTSISNVEQDVVYKKSPNPEDSNKTTFKTAVSKITTIDRKEEILNIVKSHKNASITDIKKFLTDVSDKTLQRELVKMIEMGLIRREGNKRWATYYVL